MSKRMSWIDVNLPEVARPYAHLARLDKPIGSWLLAWPAFWSVAIVAESQSFPEIMKLLVIFGLWAILIRGAGCTINDFFDRDFDKKVERTKTRPLASGALSPAQGLWWLGVQLVLGLGVLLQVNTMTFILGFIHVPLVFAYPLMKRLTYWPQAFLGVMISWGAFMGSTAVTGSIQHSVVHPLYISSFFWTLVYDTIYAHQDKEDDAKAGVKSTALRFGDLTKQWVSAFGIATIIALALSGYNANISWPYYIFLAIGAGQLTWQIWTVNLSSPADCGRKFVSNQWFGAIIFAGVILGKLFA
ncbi:hypothetical protein Leryth_020476 [Lithospermum erythrorhizon]|nr:hypothetical protein Leryth_020476 [Lithospermum erythrorhizon]